MLGERERESERGERGKKVVVKKRCKIVSNLNISQAIF
jgi:hypothetical protein